MWDLNKVNSYSQYWDKVIIEVSPRLVPFEKYIRVANGFVIKDHEIAPILYADPDKAFNAVIQKLKEFYPDDKVVFRKPPMIDVLQVEEVLYYICHCRILDPKFIDK